MVERSKKILVVDDEPDMVFLLRSRLEAAGYDVTTAQNGTVALEKMRSSPPDLVILDIMLPQMNGYQVCRELKKDKKTKNIKVLMLTAKTQESDKYWGRETGADDYMTKPFEASDLLNRIRTLLTKPTPP